MKHKLFTVLVLALLLTVSVSAQAQTSWELNQQLEITRLELYTHLNYPDGWYVQSDTLAPLGRRATVISEFETDTGEILSGTRAIQGYTITMDITRASLVSRNFGNQERNPSLQELATAVFNMYNFEVPAETVERLSLWDVPSLSYRSIDAEGNAVAGVISKTEGNFAFMLTLAAPDAEMLDAFLPTWEQIIASTRPEAVVFPELSGEYPVGRAFYHLIDENREEIFTNRGGDLRELMITVYYPANPGPDDQPAAYVEGMQRQVLMEPYTRIPAMPYAMVEQRAYENVPFAESNSTFPILVFSPGITMNPVFYTAMLEDISSHGYVVVALAHPYSVDTVVFADGKIARMNSLGTYMDPVNPDTIWMESMAHIGDVWVEDALFVLDQLEAMNQNDGLLAGHLDLTHIGIFGHSFGGATATEAAYHDDRILAVINIDAPVFGHVAAEGISQPFMTMYSDFNWQRTSAERFGMTEEEWIRWNLYYMSVARPVVEASSHGYVWTLMGSAHNTFTDVALLKPLGKANMRDFKPTMLGIIDANRAHEVTCTYILAFFDTYVKGESSPLLAGPSADYPEVELEINQAA